MGVTVEQMRANKRRHLKSFKEREAQIREAIDEAGMSVEEYERIYVPKEAANACCFICKNAIDGCRWARCFAPIHGWIAAYSKGTHSYKVFWCPEFEEEKRAKNLD